MDPAGRHVLRGGRRRARSGSVRKAHRGVADGGEDVQLGQSAQRVDALQRAAKGLVEDVADPRAAAAVEKRNGSACEAGGALREIECGQAEKVNICSQRIYMN